MKVLLRLWLCAIMATAVPSFAQTYPGAPVLTQNGPLSCGIRLYAAGAVQSYCFYTSSTAPPVTICNSLSAPVNAAAPLPNVTVTPWHACYAYDPPTNKIYDVTWWAYRQGDGSVGYQVSFEAMPCAPPTTNTGTSPSICQYQIISQAPPSNLSTGTLH